MGGIPGAPSRRFHLSRPAAGRIVMITPQQCQKCHLSDAAGNDQFALSLDQQGEIR
jgi:hypothetical protein